jgi:hypothetical protein
LKLQSILTVILLCTAKNASADTLISSVGLFVFPSKGQSSEQQAKDDYECYNWAKEQSNYDPVNPPVIEQVAAKSGPDGSRVRGALRGAARGAILGEVIDDESRKGAQIGAAAGAMSAGSSRRKNAQQEAAQINNANAAGQQTLVDNFKKAATICLEAKDYAVK